MFSPGYDGLAELDEIIWKSINGILALDHLSGGNRQKYEYYKRDLQDAVKKVAEMKAPPEISGAYSAVGKIIVKQDITNEDIENAIEFLKTGTSGLQDVYTVLQRRVMAM